MVGKKRSSDIFWYSGTVPTSIIEKNIATPHIQTREVPFHPTSIVLNTVSLKYVKIKIVKEANFQIVHILFSVVLEKKTPFHEMISPRGRLIGKIDTHRQLAANFTRVVIMIMRNFSLARFVPEVLREQEQRYDSCAQVIHREYQ